MSPTAPPGTVAPVAPVSAVAKPAAVVSRSQDPTAGPPAAPAVSKAVLSAEALRFAELLGRLPPSPAVVVRGMGVAPSVASEGYFVPLRASDIGRAMPLPTAQDIEAVLRQKLVQSGLFYEAHLREAVDGRTQWSDVEAQPQNKAMPENALQKLVGQQLDLQLLGRLSVQAEAWPGAPMQWVVEQRDPPLGGAPNNSHQASDPDTSSWRSVIRILLPHLGEVQAEVTATAGQIVLRIEVQEERSLGYIQSALPQLTESLEAAGIDAGVGAAGLAVDPRPEPSND